MVNDTTYYPDYGEPCDLMTVDIHEPEIRNSGLEIFPNPSSGNLLIRFNSHSKMLADINVSDISGRNLKCEKWEINQGMNMKSLNLGSFDKGIYFRLPDL